MRQRGSVARPGVLAGYISPMTTRLRELWRYDLVRQSTIAFGAGFLVIGVMMIIIIAATPAFRGGVSMVSPEQAELSGESRGRYYAEQRARREADLIADDLAAQDLPALLQDGSREAGYELAYSYAWNDAVRQTARRLPRQLLSREPGVQWIELLR